MVVANLAFSGLLVSWVMKFADSILKVRSTPCPAVAGLIWWLHHVTIHHSPVLNQDATSPSCHVTGRAENSNDKRQVQRLERSEHLQVYATSMAMLVTTVVSVLFFGLQPNLQLLLGIMTASMSLVLYYVSPSVLLETGKAQRLPK